MSTPPKYGKVWAQRMSPKYEPNILAKYEQFQTKYGKVWAQIVIPKHQGSQIY